MRSTLNHFAIRKYNNTVRISNRGESMGNNNYGSIFHQSAESILDQLFTRGIQGTRSYKNEREKKQYLL